MHRTFFQHDPTGFKQSGTSATTSKKITPGLATGGDDQIECCTGNLVPCESSILLIGQWSVAVGWVRQLSQDLNVQLLVEPVDAAVTKT